MNEQDANTSVDNEMRGSSEVRTGGRDRTGNEFLEVLVMGLYNIYIPFIPTGVTQMQSQTSNTHPEEKDLLLLR